MPPGAISVAGSRVIASSGQTSAQRVQSSLQRRAKHRVRCRPLSAKVMRSAGQTWVQAQQPMHLSRSTTVNHLASPVKPHHAKGTGKETQAAARTFGRVEGDRSLCGGDQRPGVAGRDPGAFFFGPQHPAGHGRVVLGRLEPMIKKQLMGMDKPSFQSSIAGCTPHCGGKGHSIGGINLRLMRLGYITIIKHTGRIVKGCSLWEIEYNLV